MDELITGIQQVGIGVVNADEAKYLYKELFGMNILVFDDNAAANLMLQYTGNTIQHRRAILTMNLMGGGGFEIWQFTSRNALSAVHPPIIGDIGIFATKIKTANITRAYNFFSSNDKVTTSLVYTTPNHNKHFWVTDSLGNIFEIVEGRSWFKQDHKPTGGVCGAVIGVSNMDSAISFYSKILGISKVEYDITDNITDGPHNNIVDNTCRRVLLSKNSNYYGAFSKLLGCVQIELIQSLKRPAATIFQDRYWGDCGFIHVCFDVPDMNLMEKHIQQLKQVFTVDSAESYVMGNSAGRFCYMEDPDGTLIELVETHKVPIVKKIGLYFNLKRRKTKKPLADWMVNLLALSKIK